MYIANSPIMSLFSAGLTTGISVESGEGLTWIVPIIDGKVVDHAVQKLTLSGKDVSEYLRTLLLGYGINITSSLSEIYFEKLRRKIVSLLLIQKR